MMRTRIKKLIDAANLVDKAYDVKSRSLSVKPNVLTLFYAIANSGNLSQSQLHNEWLLPLSTINTVTTECRNAGYIRMDPVPGTRRERYLRLTAKGRRFAQTLLADTHRAEEEAMAATLERFPDVFIDALAFYARTFHESLNGKAGDAAK